MLLKIAATLVITASILATASDSAQAQTPDWAKVSPEQITAAKELGVPVAFENSVGMRFVLIPPGKFTMGSRDSMVEVAGKCNMPNAQPGWFYDEYPSHEVTITRPFYMSIHEVTQEVFQAIENTDPNKDKNRNRRHQRKPPQYPTGFEGKKLPVTMVSFEDGLKFCNLLAAKDKRKYVLPTEAQWEYACRAGAKGPFAFGETISTEQANYNGNYTYAEGVKGENPRKPLPVGSLATNAWGLYDMHGNVREWCSDRYGAYTSEPQTDPTGPTIGNERILRGGSWESYPGAIRSAFRINTHFHLRNFTTGLRICSPVPEGEKEGEEK